MVDLKKALKERLHNAERIALLGLGSELRGDDVAGILLARQLSGYGRNLKRRVFKVFIGATAPENLTGEIKKFKPVHLIIADSADLGRRPGAVRVIEPEEVGGFTFCTHQLPLKFLTDYLIDSTGCSITIIGIQPKKIAFGTYLSSEVKKATQAISAAIKETLKA